jgi:hypothetical protein
MRRTITNICMLLAVPLTLLPIVLGASAELENRRREHFFRMRREHLRSMARDRKRKHERLRTRLAEEKRSPHTPRDERPRVPYRIRIAEKP